MTKPQVVILGAGPAGVGAAFQLTHRTLARVTVLDRNTFIGGNAGSFDLAGLRVDFGSHRLHPACDPQILQDIRTLLGDALLDRPRHGRIHLRGRWIHFPLKPLDLALKLPPTFVTGVAVDSVRKMFASLPTNGTDAGEVETFASVLEAGLGRTICRDFYFPYAHKIWGVEPSALSANQARKRVSAGSLGKMVGKVLSAVPGFKAAGSGRFFYPVGGFGQIAEVYCQAARRAGAEIQLQSTVQAIELSEQGPHSVVYEQDGVQHKLTADYVWSTIPLPMLARCLKPAPPQEYLEAAAQIEYRAMLLIYLVVDQDQFSEYDAHYFPEEAIPITRLSEPKNYSASQEPRGCTVLCAELPCAVGSREWQESDEALGELVQHSLTVAGIPLQAPIRQVVVRRLRQAYPIYHDGYEAYLDKLDHWISQLGGLLAFGRQGLFAHDNTHHALYMAYSAVTCLQADGSFDHERWQAYRRIFETHVVED